MNGKTLTLGARSIFSINIFSCVGATVLTTSYDPRTGAMQDAGYRLSRTLRTRTSSTELLLIGFLRSSFLGRKTSDFVAKSSRINRTSLPCRRAASAIRTIERSWSCVRQPIRFGCATRRRRRERWSPRLKNAPASREKVLGRKTLGWRGKRLSPPPQC